MTAANLMVVIMNCCLIQVPVTLKSSYYFKERHISLLATLNLNAQYSYIGGDTPIMVIPQIFYRTF